METQQEIIDKLIDYIDTAILKNSVSNRHVAAVLAFLNEGLKSKNVDIEELAKVFLRRDQPDQTEHLLKALAGMEFGNFIPGMLGGSGASITIDEYGRATYEGDRMILREELVVPKITFNCLDVISGDKANTFSFGTIKSVDKENLIATLDLVGDQIGTPRSGDICRGVFHSLEGGNHTKDLYDNNGYLNYSGFSTAYFTPTDIIESKPGVMTFKYALQAETSVHPMPGMNFFAYGSFTDKDRQSITYENRYYTRRLKNVNTWVINPDRNIAMQDGLLDGLTIGGMVMKGHGTFMENCYFTGTQIQFTPEQKEELAGQDAYSVNLSSYGESVVVDSDWGVIGGLTEDRYITSEDRYITSEDKYLVASLYRIKTLIQCFKGENELFFSTGYKKGGYMVTINPMGCKAIVDSGIVAITEITDFNSCYVDIAVNCEGNVVFNKRFSLSILKNGSSPVIADIDNEMASVACDKDGVVLFGLPVSTNVSMWYGATQLVLDAIDLELPAGVIAVSDTITGAVTITECNTSTIVNKIGIVVRATYAGDSHSKRLSFVLNKILPGADGKSPTIYSIYTTSNSVKLDNNATYTPTSVGAYVMKTEGSITSQLTALPTGLTLHFAWVPDGVLTSITNGQFLSARYFQDAITLVLKKDGVVIDKEVIPIIRDGSDGSDGVNGADGGFTQLRYRNSLSLPSTPSGSDPSGWRLSPDDVRSIDSYTGSFQLKDGYYESPYPSSSSVLYTSRISLTTTQNNQIVFIELDLQTGSDLDRVYVSELNKSYVNGAGYMWVGWGTKKVIFPMIIPYYGGNFFEIAYKKNSAINTYGDKVRYRVIEVNRCWLSTAYIRANTPTTWSVPTEFIPDTDKEERIYIRSKRNLTVDLPTSDEFVNDYIGVAPIYDNLKAYTVGNIVRYQISSNFVYKVCISNCVGKTPTLTDYWDDIEWWKDDPSGATAEYPYEFTCLRNKENGRWSYYKQYQLFLKYAKDGEDANILVSSVTQIGLSKTGAYEPSSFIVYHKNPKGDLLNTYLAAYGSDNGSSWTMLGSVQNSSSITVNVAVYPYRYYVIRSYRTGNINYTSEYLLSTSVNTIKDGSDGAVGPSGAQPRNRGFFKVGTEYTYDRLYRDIVLYNFGSFTYVFQVKTYGATISTPPTSSTGDNNWESADKYSFVAMDTALIDGANIAGFMYKNQVMLSSAGTLDGIKKDVGEVASDQQYLFEPNVTLDGNTGRMSGNLRSPYIPFKTMAAMQDSWNWSWFIHDWTTYSAVNGSMFGTKFKYNGIRFRIMNSYTIAISIYIPFQFSGKSDSTLSKINIAPGTRFEGEFIPRAKSFGLSNIEDGLSYPYSVVLFGVSPLTDNGIISDPTYTSIQTYTTKTV